MPDNEWTIKVEFSEDETHTHATASAVAGDMDLSARGDAYRHPKDSSQPLVGEQIAAARALIGLGTQLLQSAARHIEDVTHRPAHLVR